MEDVTTSVKATDQPEFPGIEDHDALQYLCLRYLFCEHDFVSLPWKAMQQVGWTHSSSTGRYQSPCKTVSLNAKDLIKKLDSVAVPSGCSNLQVDLPHNMSKGQLERKATKELRDSICYHMQILIEKIPSTTASSGKRKTDSSTKSIGEKKMAAHPLRSSRTHHISNQTTITASEKGAALYMHKTTRSNKSKKLLSIERKDVEDSHEAMMLPTVAECEKVMSMFDQSKSDELEAFYERNFFGQWRHLLSTNHSLLLYGNGSKHKLLNLFSDVELSKEGYSLHINAFDSRVSADEVLDLLVNTFLDGNEPNLHKFKDDQSDHAMISMLPHVDSCRSGTSLERAGLVARELSQVCSKSRTPIFLIVHSIEGLNTDYAQGMFAALVANSIPPGGEAATIRMVASLDHVDAPSALWSSDTSFNFCWYQKEVHTYRPYAKEVSMLTDLDMAAKKASRKRNRMSGKPKNIMNVLHSLAPRHTLVIKVLAKLQLKQLQSSETSEWVKHKTFSSECKSNLIADKDSKLRAFETELHDHGLLVYSKIKSVEHVSIPYDESKLSEILQYERSD